VVSLGIFSEATDRTICPGIDSASKNEYQENSWSLTLRKECRLRVFENTVLRRIFEPKRDEVTGERRRRLHYKELYAL
jgi:hypothetical protein